MVFQIHEKGEITIFLKKKKTICYCDFLIGMAKESPDPSLACQK